MVISRNRLAWEGLTDTMTLEQTPEEPRKWLFGNLVGNIPNKRTIKDQFSELVAGFLYLRPSRDGNMAKSLSSGTVGNDHA